MLTADTITDDDVYKMLKPASEEGAGALDVYGEYITAAEVIDLCDAAVMATPPGVAAKRRNDARARVAEILNARKAT